MLKRNRYLKAYDISKHMERMVAWLPEHRKWNDHLSKTETLKVFFMNDCLVPWNISQDFLMQILNDSWTGCFTLGDEETHHIRVKFEGNISIHYVATCCFTRIIFVDDDFSNWTAIGAPALLINHRKPTMSLNFRNMNEQEIRATVIHQFGHALGLGHALMKPEDWHAVKYFVNVEEMVKSYGANNEEEFEIQWTGKEMSEKAKYSEKSIMRYRQVLNMWLCTTVHC